MDINLHVQGNDKVTHDHNGHLCEIIVLQLGLDIKVTHDHNGHLCEIIVLQLGLDIKVTHDHNGHLCEIIVLQLGWIFTYREMFSSSSWCIGQCIPGWFDASSPTDP